MRFGYRTLDSGEVAIAAFMPDLVERSGTHVRRWSAFHLSDPNWSLTKDEQFESWTRRYLDGDWGVESGPLAQLRKAMATVNAITMGAVGMALFANGLSEALPFPSAENTYRYEDAHAELYRYLIDGLDKECIVSLAQRFGRPIKASSDKTVQALKKALPPLADVTVFNFAFDLVSEQRRKSDHKVRPAAVTFPAFEQFREDLWACRSALKELIATLEHELGVKGDDMVKRHEAKKYLPVIAAKADPHFSVCQAERMIGKTVERVEYGIREPVASLHRSEVLIIHFTDGSILGIDTGSNVVHLSLEKTGLQPNDFHVDLNLQWVPEKT